MDPPKLWLKGDLSQIEMVLIAVVTEDENLINLLQAGKDVYVAYGARIFHRKPERGPGDDEVTDLLRDVAKIPTLGTCYGLTPFGFVHRIRDELGIDYEIYEAEAFFETFFEMFHGIAAYHTKAAEEAFNAESVRTIGGTRRYLPPLIDDHVGDYWPSFERRKKILVNTPIQGSGADLVIWAVNQFMPQLPAGVEIVNLVHDEVDAIVTEETLRPTVEIITRAFQETFARFYPSSTLAIPSDRDVFDVCGVVLDSRGALGNFASLLRGLLQTQASAWQEAQPRHPGPGASDGSNHLATLDPTNAGLTRALLRPNTSEASLPSELPL